MLELMTGQTLEDALKIITAKQLDTLRYGVDDPDFIEPEEYEAINYVGENINFQYIGSDNIDKFTTNITEKDITLIFDCNEFTITGWKDKSLSDIRVLSDDIPSDIYKKNYDNKYTDISSYMHCDTDAFLNTEGFRFETVNDKANSQIYIEVEVDGASELKIMNEGTEAHMEAFTVAHISLV